MEKSGNLAVSLAVMLISLYRSVSAFGVRRCRFYPTCSAYAQDAFRMKGFWGGARLSLQRILKCHPWHVGGYDPVALAQNEELVHGQ